jgi:ribosomal protein S18 acetylase RimI-like enzyme
MKIRKATNKDLSQIIELWKKYEKFEESLVDLDKHPYVKKRKNAEKNMRANFFRVIKSKKAEILIAEENKEIVGFILISKSKSDDIHNFDFYGEMNYMYIKPEFRGKGIASEFFRQAKKWFKQQGLKYLRLDVNINNKKTRKIYQKWGFNDYEIGMWRRLE